MWILPLVGYTGILVGFCFLTLAIGTSHTPFPLPSLPPSLTPF